MVSSYTITAARANLIYQIARINGLDADYPLVIGPTSRESGSLVQSIDGTDTVTIHTVSPLPILAGPLEDWIDALAALHGLTSPLVCTDTSMTAGDVALNLVKDGDVITSTRQ